MRTRFVAAASLCLLPLLGVIFYILDQSLSNSRDQLYETEVAFAEVVSRGINQTLQENQDVLTSLSANPAISVDGPDHGGRSAGAGQGAAPQPGRALPARSAAECDRLLRRYRSRRRSRPRSRPQPTSRSPAGESAITGKLVVPEGEVEVIAMVSPVLAPAEDGTEATGNPVGAIGSFISVDRLQRAFLPVAGESESQTSVVLLSADGVIADQETPTDTGQVINAELEQAVAESVAGKRVQIDYTDPNGVDRMGVLLAGRVSRRPMGGRGYGPIARELRTERNIGAQ